MEDNIRKAFDSLTMPEACDEKIRLSLRRSHSRIWRPLTVAAGLLLAVLILAQPPVVRAVEQAAQNLRQLVVSRLFPNAAVKEQYVFEDGAYVHENGVLSDGSPYSGGIYHGGMPTWLDDREDGLYFTGNGEELEIGSLISMDTPFTYQFTDEKGIRHYLAVGGIYAPSEEANIGWSEWFQKPPYDASGWIGGYGTNHWDKEADAKWPWLEKAEDIMQIPWH